MATTTGYIAMADISGYTTFVAATELEHSREILSELLEVTSTVLERHLVPVRLQGDAIICVAGPDEDVVACLETAFVAFHRRVRAMVSATTCPCNACRTVPSLTLKFVAHRGEYSTVDVRGTKDLVGADVNVAFRLLKNHVPSREYVLVTRPVLERLPAPARDRFTATVEEYDVGRVEAFYRDLHGLREEAARPLRPPVRREEAHLRVGTTVDAPPEVVWSVYTDARAFQRIVRAPRVDLERGARGTMHGAAYHCHHGKDAEVIFEVVGLREPNVLTLWIYGDGPDAYGTYYLDPLPGGRTKVELVVRFEGARGPKLFLTVAFWRFFLAKGMGELRAIVAERRAAAATG